MSKIKRLLEILIEKGDFEALKKMGANPQWIAEARLNAVRKQRRNSHEKPKR